jgi:hypothetical protein
MYADEYACVHQCDRASLLSTRSALRAHVQLHRRCCRLTGCAVLSHSRAKHYHRRSSMQLSAFISDEKPRIFIADGRMKTDGRWTTASLGRVTTYEWASQREDLAHREKETSGNPGHECTAFSHHGGEVKQPDGHPVPDFPG